MWVNDLLLIFCWETRVVLLFCVEKCAGHPKVGGFVAPKTGENGFRSHCLKKRFLAGAKKRNKVHYMQLGVKWWMPLQINLRGIPPNRMGYPKMPPRNWKSVPSHSSFSRNDSGKFPSCLKREINNLKGGATTGSRYGIHTNQANPELREHSPSKISPVTWQNKKCNLI